MEGMIRPTTLANPTVGRNGEAVRSAVMATSRSERRKLVHSSRCGDASGRRPALAKEPWRGTKPMEGEGDCSLATATAATDPTAEQSLEVEGRRTSHRKRCPKRRHDDEGATTTAMWRGCWRGDFFEGCEGAVGETPDRPDFHRPPDLSGGTCLRAEEEWSTVVETLRTPSGTGMQ